MAGVSIGGLMEAVSTCRLNADRDHDAKQMNSNDVLHDFYATYAIHPFFAEFADKALEREYQHEENIRSIPRRKKVIRIWTLCEFL
jgi:1,6-anhydro-N-acetylmuramate kinase